MAIGNKKPAILEIARGEIGVREIKGSGSTARILDYFRAAKYDPERGDDDPWCGGFLAWVVTEAGYVPPLLAARARAWLDWGVDVMGDPQPGDIVIFPRGKNPSAGHVTVLERIEGHRWTCVGGNQGNAVSRRAFDSRKAIGVRRAASLSIAAPEPAGLPAVKAAAKSSWTVTGGLVALLGAVVQFFNNALTVLMEAAAQVATWSPASDLLGTMGANAQAIGFGLAVTGVGTVIARRAQAAHEGKIG